MSLRGAVYVNGESRVPKRPSIPVYDHGFLYGEGVYETLRTYNRVPFLYDRHVRRLRASAGHFQLPVPFSDDELESWITDTMAAAGEMREAYIRVLLTRGVGEPTYDVRSTPRPRWSSSSSRSKNHQRACWPRGSRSRSSPSCATIPDR